MLMLEEMYRTKAHFRNITLATIKAYAAEVTNLIAVPLRILLGSKTKSIPHGSLRVNTITARGDIRSLYDIAKKKDRFSLKKNGHVVFNILLCLLKEPINRLTKVSSLIEQCICISALRPPQGPADEELGFAFLNANRITKSCAGYQFGLYSVAIAASWMVQHQHTSYTLLSEYQS